MYTCFKEVFCMNQEQLYAALSREASLPEVQKYIQKVIQLRGFGDQSTQASLLLLLEEVGELAKAVRKNTKGMSVDNSRISNYDTIESEVADVLIVLISICNSLGIDLFDALKEKERVNCERTWRINNKS